MPSNENTGNNSTKKPRVTVYVRKPVVEKNTNSAYAEYSYEDQEQYLTEFADKQSGERIAELRLTTKQEYIKQHFGNFIKSCDTYLSKKDFTGLLIFLKKEYEELAESLKNENQADKDALIKQHKTNMELFQGNGWKPTNIQMLLTRLEIELDKQKQAQTASVSQIAPSHS